MARSRRTTLERGLARGLLVIMGLGSVVWAASVAPYFWREAVFTQAAAHIVNGEAFKPDALADLSTRLEQSTGSPFRSSVLDRLAVVRLRIAEKALSGGASETIDSDTAALDASVRDALTNAPADPFLWLTLAWLDNIREGFTPLHLRYLEMSYRLGPHEGWIALRRNPFTLAIGPALPADLKEKAVSEFVGLVRWGSYEQAAQILIGPGWSSRDTLLDSLKSVSQADRQQFAKDLYDKGVDDVVPGTEPLEKKPWIKG